MRTKPFKNDAMSPVEKYPEGWGFYVYAAVGSERWVGNYSTREEARKARREYNTEGTGYALERDWR